jgi:hypothetical protein
MGEHDDDLEVTGPSESGGGGDAARVAAALACGLRQVAAAIEHGLAEVAAAITVDGNRHGANKQ